MAAHSIPRPEHPRPDFRRDEWLNLNGVWEFRYDPQELGEGQQWSQPHAAGFDQTILVPFPWQSDASGQKNADYRGVAWYRRTFAVSPAWEGRPVFLHFGAVDYDAAVWVNGRLAGRHEGGYTPFAFDITDMVQPGENTLVVRVLDPADLSEIPHGKQKSIPADPWQSCEFTPSSGIWQTVWLEARPPSHFTALRITPDVDGARTRFDLTVQAGAGGGNAAILAEIQPPQGEALHARTSLTLAAGQTNSTQLTIDIPDPQLWDLDTPNLYQVTLRLQLPGQAEDVLHTYFGMRTVATRDGKMWLNGRPIYLMSALDQGFWPEGLHTAPSDEALRADVAFAKAAGLNSLRKHIKIEDPRFIYWADVLGLLLWCDVPSPNFFTDLACQRLARDVEAMIERDYNHPSIVIWCPYNESWGFEFRLAANPAMQAWAAEIYDRIKAWDPTRLVVDNSGWSHVKTDIADFHYYTAYNAEWRSVVTMFAREPDESAVLDHPLFAHGYTWQGEPLMMSEYGAGWKDDRSWDLRWQTNELRRHPEIVGYTYTELYDIEHERAGYALYDRTPKNFGFELAAINTDDFVVLDYRGPVALWPGEPLRVDIYASVYGPPLHEAALHWRITRFAAPGEEPQTLLHGEQAVQVQAYTVTRLPDLAPVVPDTPGPIRLEAWLVDSAGKARGRNYLDFEVFRTPLPRLEQSPGPDGTTFVLRFSPEQYVAAQWSAESCEAAPASALGRPIYWGRADGYVEYAAPLPPAATGPFTRLTLHMEAGSRPAEITQSIVGQAQPSGLTVSLNGREVATVNMADLYVHAGGALTRLNRLGPGEHGDRVELSVPQALLAEVEARARREGQLVVRLAVAPGAAQRGGLTLFGARSGRYGLDPTLVLQTANS